MRSAETGKQTSEDLAIAEGQPGGIDRLGRNRETVERIVPPLAPLVPALVEADRHAQAQGQRAGGRILEELVADASVERNDDHLRAVPLDAARHCPHRRISGLTRRQ